METDVEKGKRRQSLGLYQAVTVLLPATAPLNTNLEAVLELCKPFLQQRKRYALVILDKALDVVKGVES